MIARTTTSPWDSGRQARQKKAEHLLPHYSPNNTFTADNKSTLSLSRRPPSVPFGLAFRTPSRSPAAFDTFLAKSRSSSRNSRTRSLAALSTSPFNSTSSRSNSISLTSVWPRKIRRISGCARLMVPAKSRVSCGGAFQRPENSSTAVSPASPMNNTRKTRVHSWTVAADTCRA